MLREEGQASRSWGWAPSVSRRLRLRTPRKNRSRIPEDTAGFRLQRSAASLVAMLMGCWGILAPENTSASPPPRQPGHPAKPCAPGASPSDQPRDPSCRRLKHRAFPGITPKTHSVRPLKRLRDDWERRAGTDCRASGRDLFREKRRGRLWVQSTPSGGRAAATTPLFPPRGDGIIK